MDGYQDIGRDELFLEKLTNLVQENLENEQFSVEILAKLIGISRSQLHRKLKLLTGQSASQFIRDIRLKEANRLLANDVASISEIAYRVGFQSPSYFHKCFHEFYGISPGELMKKNGDKSAYDGLNGEKSSKVKHFKIGVIALLFMISFSTIYLLKGNRRAAPVEKIHIAIMPFESLSIDKDDEFFAKSLVYNLKRKLSQLEGLRLIESLSSEEDAHNGNRLFNQVAKKLDYLLLVKGIVQRIGDIMEVNIEIIDAKNNEIVYSHPFSVDTTRLIKVQSEIAFEIANELNLELSKEERIILEHNSSENPKAMEYFLMGLVLYDRMTPSSMERSKNYFKKAIKEDPNFANAYGGLAMSYAAFVNSNINLDSAFYYSSKALSLDSTSVEAYTVLIQIAENENYDWEEAKRLCYLSLKKRKNSDLALRNLAAYYALINQTEKARYYINRAIEENPTSYLNRHFSSWLFYNVGDTLNAEKELELSWDVSIANPMNTICLFSKEKHKGNVFEALDAIESYGKETRTFNDNQVDSTYKSSGLNGMYDLIIKTVDDNFYKAEILAIKNKEKNEDLILNLLELSFQDETLKPYFAYRILFKDFHDDPRFISLLRKTKLYPYYKNEILALQAKQETN